jgi:hypothetical protein
MAVPIIAAGVSVAGALLGQLLAGKDRAEAERIMQQVRNEFGQIDPAKVKMLAMDPQADTAMSDSLERMGDVVRSGGMTVQDRASLNDALDATGRQERAQRSAILSRFRGGDSSQALLAALTNQQGAAERAQGAGLSAAGEAQRRYFQALRDRAGMGQAVQDSRSAVDRWNNSYGQQAWENKFRTVAGKAGLDQAAAGQRRADADRTAGAWAGVGDYGGRAVMQYDDDKRRKDSLAGPGYGF